jgi:hypothetical protein
VDNAVLPVCDPNISTNECSIKYTAEGVNRQKGGGRDSPPPDAFTQQVNIFVVAASAARWPEAAKAATTKRSI